MNNPPLSWSSLTYGLGSLIVPPKTPVTLSVPSSLIAVAEELTAKLKEVSGWELKLETWTNPGWSLTLDEERRDLPNAYASTGLGV